MSETPQVSTRLRGHVLEAGKVVVTRGRWLALSMWFAVLIGLGGRRQAGRQRLPERLLPAGHRVAEGARRRRGSAPARLPRRSGRGW